MAKKIRGFGGRNFRKPSQNQIKDLLKLQEEFQSAMSALEEKYENETVEASAGGGVVKVIVTCSYKVLDVEYDEDIVEDKDMFKDLLVAAFNQAMELVEKRRKELADENLPKIGGLENLL